MKILVVEDDRDIREMVCRSLAQNDLQAIGCHDVQQARQMMKTQRPDGVVLDWMLPDGSGIEFLRWLRRTEPFRQVPVLMLTARAQESDMIAGLEAGADDYLGKPMSLRELNARVRALLRRPAAYQEQLDQVELGPIRLNYRTREVLVGETPVNLTRTEFNLLRMFLDNPNRVFSREQILDAVWGVDAYLGERTVDVHILRLRKLLKPHGVDTMIVTVRGSGYRFTA